MPLNLDIAKLSKRFLFLKGAAVQILQLCSIVPRSFRSRVAFVVPARRSAHWWLATELWISRYKLPLLLACSHKTNHNTAAINLRTAMICQDGLETKVQNKPEENERAFPRTTVR